MKMLIKNINIKKSIHNSIYQLDNQLEFRFELLQ